MVAKDRGIVKEERMYGGIECFSRRSIQCARSSLSSSDAEDLEALMRSIV